VLAIVTQEALAGNIAASLGWPDIAGSPLELTVDSESVVFNLQEGSFSGRVKGRLSLLAVGGPLEGNFTGTVSGTFSDPTDLTGSIQASLVQVSWTAQGAEFRASGQAEAHFSTELGNQLGCGVVAGAAPFGGLVTLQGRWVER